MRAVATATTAAAQAARGFIAGRPARAVRTPAIPRAAALAASMQEQLAPPPPWNEKGVDNGMKAFQDGLQELMKTHKAFTHPVFEQLRDARDSGKLGVCDARRYEDLMLASFDAATSNVAHLQFASTLLASRMNAADAPASPAVSGPAHADTALHDIRLFADAQLPILDEISRRLKRA